jgi:ferredoxin
MTGEAQVPACRVEIDRHTCMGSGNCSYWAPGVFDLDGDGVATVVGDVNEHIDEVRSAAENCPTAAITIIEAENRTI